MRLVVRHSYRCIAVMALGLCACSGASVVPRYVPASVTDGPSSRGSASEKSATAKLVITLPPIRNAQAPIDWSTPLPATLSPATASIQGSVDGRAFGPLPLNSSIPGCASVSSSLQCTITVKASVGQRESLILRTFAAPSVSRSPLALSVGKLNIFPGKNYVQISPTGLAQQVATSVSPKVVRQGQWRNLNFVVYAKDVANAIIASNDVTYGNGSKPLTSLLLTFRGFHIGSWHRKCCGFFPDELLYHGTESGNETITTSAVDAIGVKPETTTVRVLAGSTQKATVLVTNQYVNEYIQGSSGDPPPTRSFALLDRPFPVSEDAAGNFWVSHYYGGPNVAAERVTNAGDILGTVQFQADDLAKAMDSNGNFYAAYTSQGDQFCRIDEYHAASYGTAHLVRQILCPGTTGISSPTALALAVDPSGNIFAVDGMNLDDTSQTEEILEYAPGTGSGRVPPIRTIPAPSPAVSGAVTGFGGIATDGAGNLYAQYSDGTAASADELLVYAPGSTSGTKINLGVAFNFFAVNNAGDIFVDGSFSGSQPFIAKFPAGATTASWMISGPNVLTGPIVVPKN